MAAALVSAVAVGVTNYLQAAGTIRHEIEVKLGALEEVRRSALEDYLESIRQDLRILAGSETALQAVGDLAAAYRQSGPQAGVELQRLYITENPHPTG